MYMRISHYMHCALIAVAKVKVTFSKPCENTVMIILSMCSTNSIIIYLNKLILIYFLKCCFNYYYYP